MPHAHTLAELFPEPIHVSDGVAVDEFEGVHVSFVATGVLQRGASVGAEQAGLGWQWWVKLIRCCRLRT